MISSQKTVFVTGSSRGIGKAVAAAFAAQGCKVVLNCVKNAGLLHEFENELKRTNKDIMSVICDMSNYHAARDAYGRIAEKFGGVDILVNNAGVSYVGTFDAMKPEEWQRLIDVNINSMLNATHLCLPYMLKNHVGCVINISSIWGEAGASCEAVYSMTKGGVNAFTKALAKETAPNGVRVNAISCGVIDTDMNAFLEEDEKNSLIEKIPLGRFGKPSEAAGLAVFLASEEASYITGQIITVDGGFL